MRWWQKNNRVITSPAPPPGAPLPKTQIAINQTSHHHHNLPGHPLKLNYLKLNWKKEEGEERRGSTYLTINKIKYALTSNQTTDCLSKWKQKAGSEWNFNHRIKKSLVMFLQGNVKINFIKIVRSTRQDSLDLISAAQHSSKDEGWIEEMWTEGWHTPQQPQHTVETLAERKLQTF